jgi:hypothetical protein
MKIGTNSTEGENKERAITKMAVNGQQDNTQNKEGGRTNETNNSSNDENKRREDNTDENNNKKTNNGTNKNTGDNNKNNNNGSINKARVSILTPGEMATYTFTISWRPENKSGQDGKIIIRMLMREMAHRTPQITFHPTNSANEE